MEAKSHMDITFLSPKFTMHTLHLHKILF